MSSSLMEHDLKRLLENDQVEATISCDDETPVHTTCTPCPQPSLTPQETPTSSTTSTASRSATPTSTAASTASLQALGTSGACNATNCKTAAITLATTSKPTTASTPAQPSRSSEQASATPLTQAGAQAVAGGRITASPLPILSAGADGNSSSSAGNGPGEASIQFAAQSVQPSLLLMACFVVAGVVGAVVFVALRHRRRGLKRRKAGGSYRPRPRRGSVLHTSSLSPWQQAALQHSAHGGVRGAGKGSNAAARQRAADTLMRLGQPTALQVGVFAKKQFRSQVAATQQGTGGAASRHLPNARSAQHKSKRFPGRSLQTITFNPATSSPVAVESLAAGHTVQVTAPVMARTPLSRA